MDDSSSGSLIDISNINEKVYNLLRRRIIYLKYPPGHKINVRDLQKELGISQTPIKDALFRLAGEGMVDISSRKGTYVKDITEKDIREIEEARIILETAAAEIVARKITDEQLENLSRILQKTMIPVKKFDYRLFLEKDFAFHLEIMRLTGNQRLISMFNLLNAHMQIFRFQFAKQRKGPLPGTHQDHLEIMEALKQRDPKKARQAILSHREKARDAFLGKKVD
jgi:GntR family transcriptional regulator, rspAB operon transcriptional repressor